MLYGLILLALNFYCHAKKIIINSWKPSIYTVTSNERITVPLSLLPVRSPPKPTALASACPSGFQHGGVVMVTTVCRSDPNAIDIMNVSVWGCFYCGGTDRKLQTCTSFFGEESTLPVLGLIYYWMLNVPSSEGRKLTGGVASSGGLSVWGDANGERCRDGKGSGG